MKRALIAVVLCLVFGWSAVARQSDAGAAASKEDVERLLDTMHSRDMMVKMLDAMTKPMHQVMHEQFMKQKDVLPPDFEAQMNKMMDDMMKDLPINEMLEAMVPAYENHFTKGDIDALVAFYSSPVGQKVIRDMPVVTAEAMQSMMPIMSQYMEKVQQRAQKEVADMVMKAEKKGGQNPPAKEK